MARFHDVRPAGIVRCRTPADASAAIGFAQRAGLPVSIRCGGHSVAGRSATEGMVIDVTPMSRVEVSGRIASVGAGARLGELYEALHEHGVTNPAGCGPAVGIAGLAIGGGIGILGRTYGLTCDRLLGRAVLAFLGATLGIMPVLLLGIRAGPVLIPGTAASGGTTIFQAFGYLGLFFSLVLIMRVTVAIIRDGIS